MPKTATRLPLAGTIGLLLLALGAGLAIARRRAHG
jgi:LPXTG-motif cell wall-anchored protein